MTGSAADAPRSLTLPAPALVVLAALSLNFGAAFARTQFPVTGPIGGTLLRLTFATTVLLLMYRPRVWTWTGPQWGAALSLGVVLGLLNQLIYLSFDRIPIGVALTVEFLGPLTLALVQARWWGDVVWALLALLGVGLIGFQATRALNVGGVVLAALAGACWALYILASARMGRAFSNAEGLPVSMAAAAIVALPLGAAGATNALTRPSVLLVFVGVGIASSVIPYALELRALRTLSSRVFGTMQSVGPAAGALAGLAVLHQRLTWRETLALALVTAATVGTGLASRRGHPGRADQPDDLSTRNNQQKGALHE